MLRFLKKQYLPLMLLFLTLSLSLTAAKNIQAAFYGMAKLCEFLLLGIAALSVLKQNRQVFLTCLPIVLSFSVLSVSVLAILQFYLQHSIGGILYFFGERSFSSETPGIANASLQGVLVLRPYATFPHPNVLGMYLLMAQTIVVSGVIGVIRNRQEKYRKVITLLEIGAVLLGSVALFLTLGRVTFLLWLSGCGFFLLYLFRHIRYKKIVVSAATLIGVLMGIYFLPLVLARFASLSFKEEAISDRVALADKASEMITNHLFTGVGLLNFLPRLSDVSESTFILLQPVHNIFLLAIAETGLIGGTLFVSLFFTCFFAIRSSSLSSIRPVCYFLLGCIVISGLTDHYFLTLQQGQMMITIFFAGCFAFNEKKNR